MRKILIAMGFLLISVMNEMALDNFTLVETWKPGDEVVGRVFFSLVDKDDHIVATFYKVGNRLIKPKGVIPFAPRGQGPGDLMDIQALFSYNDDIAFVENPGKIKIFKKESGNYQFKEIAWLKRGKFIHVVRDGIFIDRKWFLSGAEYLTDTMKSKGRRELSYLKVLSEKGKPLKNLIHKTYPDYSGAYQSHLLYYYLAARKGNIFFMAENDLKVHLIPIKELEVKRVIDLQIPPFYRKMPTGFFRFKKYDKPGENFLQDWEKWQTEYSRIHKVLVEGDYLVLQMRTCDPKLKKFALLFYNADTFKLEKTILTNDYLLGARNGRYYFFANGDPGRDEEAEDLIIHIYSFGIKNEKK